MGKCDGGGGPDVVGAEDMHQGNERWRQGPKNRNDNIPTKIALPQHQRVRWARSRDTKLAHRETPRPIRTEEEWAFLSEDITWGHYKKSPSQMVRMWMFRKNPIGCSDRGSRGARIKSLRRFDERSTRRRIDELAKNNPTLQETIAKDMGVFVFLR